MKCRIEQGKLTLLVGIATIAVALAIGLVLPQLAPRNPNAVDLADALRPPQASFPFGTDRLGRCVLSRVLCGAPTSILTTMLLVLIVSVAGTAIGLLAGYAGGGVDAAVTLVTDIFLAFPNLILAIAMAGILGPGLFNASLAIATASWTKYARLARELTLEEKNKHYVLAARISGAGPLRALVAYMLPNILPQVLVVASSDIGGVLLALAGLSFLGLGAQPPAAEWGYMLYEGKSMLQQAPWLTLFPGLAIFATVCLFNFVSDALGEALNPKETGRLLNRPRITGDRIP